MANPELNLIVSLTDKASAQLKSISAQFKDFGAQLTKIGGGMTAAGAAMTAALAMAVKGAADEESGVIRLSAALRNVGVGYDKVKSSLEGYIRATEKSTAYSDGEQRDALTNLVTLTHDYNQALTLMQLSMDLAANQGMDLASAAEQVGRVSQGNTRILMQLGIEMREGASAAEALAAINDKVAGSAEAMGKGAESAFKRLKNAADDLKEAIGGALLPTIVPMVAKFTDFLRNLQETNPQMVETAAVVAACAAAFLTLGGAMLMAAGQLPNIIAGLTTLIPLIGITTGELGLAVAAAAAWAALILVTYTMIDNLVRKLQGLPEVTLFDRLKASVQEATGSIMDLSREMMGLPKIGVQLTDTPEITAMKEAAMSLKVATPYSQSVAGQSLIADAIGRQERSLADIVNATMSVKAAVDRARDSIMDQTAAEQARQSDALFERYGLYKGQNDPRWRPGPNAGMPQSSGFADQGDLENWLFNHPTGEGDQAGYAPRTPIPGQPVTINVNIDGKTAAKALSPYLGDSYRQQKRLK